MALVLDGTNGVSGVDGTASNPSLEGTDSNTGVFFPAADTVAIGTGGTEALRVNSSQNVGIGTSSPSGILHTYKSNAVNYFESPGISSVALQFVTNNVNRYRIGIPSGSNDLQFLAGGTTETMRLDSSGNLGLGVTPSAWGSGYTPIQGLGYSLYSGNTVQTRLSANEYFSSTASTYRVNGAAALYQQAGGVHSWHYAASGTAENTISFTQAMTLDASGNLLVGATSGVVGAERISVNAGSNRGIVLKTSSSSNELVGCWSSATSGNNRFAIFWTETSATERGSIDYNRTGGLTRYNTTSDATLKNIIGDSDGQRSLDILSTTRIREFAWKDDEQQKLQIGVIAQELYETYKGAVSVGGEDAEGNYKPWGVDKTAFTFHLIAGWQAHEKLIKEQQAMIDDMKAEIAALKAQP